MLVPLPAPGGDAEVLRFARALASMPSDTVLSDRSAAQLWDLWIPPWDGIEVTSPATWRTSRYTTSVQRRAVTAHRRILPPSDVTRHCGLPVTTLGRTWLDLAAVLDVHDLVAAGDAALRAGADPSELRERAASAVRVRGAQRARIAAPLLNVRSRSRPESRIRAAVVLAGLPEPEVNRAVTDAYGGWLAEPDLHYREAKVALEYNGAEHADLERMRKDSSRVLDLQRAGWEVRIYTASHAFRHLDDVVADVHDLLRRRAPHLLAATALSQRVTFLHDQRRRKTRL